VYPSFANLIQIPWGSGADYDAAAHLLAKVQPAASNGNPSRAGDGALNEPYKTELTDRGAWHSWRQGETGPECLQLADVIGYWITLFQAERGPWGMRRIRTLAVCGWFSRCEEHAWVPGWTGL